MSTSDMMQQLDNLCTAIEPVGRNIMCQRPRLHNGPHRAVKPERGGGIYRAEWFDRSQLKRREFLGAEPHECNICPAA
jgi:hypothetical protein